MSSLIDQVREHSDEVGECWEWRKSFKPDSVTPMTAYEGQWINVRRAIAIDLGLLDGRNAKKVAAARCLNWRCVNPEHVQAITHKALRKRAMQNRVGGKLIAGRKASDRRRKRAKLTIDQVRAIRADERSCQVLAVMYGVSKQCIWQIRQGHIWKDYAGVFAQLVGVVT